MGAAEPPLWMAVDDVFHIRGRGTVVTGQLRGDGQLSVGDTLLSDDGRRWKVNGIEQLRTALMTAEPGSNIGVFLDAGPALQMLRETRVWFEPAAVAGMGTRSQPPPGERSAGASEAAAARVIDRCRLARADIAIIVTERPKRRLGARKRWTTFAASQIQNFSICAHARPIAKLFNLP